QWLRGRGGVALRRNGSAEVLLSAEPPADARVLGKRDGSARPAAARQPAPPRATPLRKRQPSPPALRRIKAVAFALGLLPLARLVAGFFLDRLGANPIELITRSTGTWT